MKLTKRMKNALIQRSIINVFFFLILVGVFAFFAFPKIHLLEEEKQELQQLYVDISKLEKSGMDYTLLRQEIISQGLSKDTYTKTLLQNIDRQFYTENFVNTGSQSYSDFLGGLDQKVKDIKQSQEYVSKDDTLGKILPVYSQKNSFSEEGLSDFLFINYIEKLLYSFDLQSKGEIGVGDVKKVGEEEKKEKNKSTDLQEDIFKIPLHFEIVGQKSNVVDFIHFFEYVGAISMEGDSLSLYNDNFIKKYIQGEKRQETYNIYENQLADIETIIMSKYPDSSTVPEGEESLISLMKTQQSRERVSIELDINFYVTGIPAYKMDTYIQDTIVGFQDLSKRIALDTKKYTQQSSQLSNGKQLQALQALQGLDRLMGSLSEDIKKLQGAFAKRDNIEEVFQGAIDYSTQIERIEDKYRAQIKVLFTNTDK